MPGTTRQIVARRFVERPGRKRPDELLVHQLAAHEEGVRSAQLASDEDESERLAERLEGSEAGPEVQRPVPYGIGPILDLPRVVSWNRRIVLDHHDPRRQVTE